MVLLLLAGCLYYNDPTISLHLLAALGALSFITDWGCNSWGWGDFYPHGRKSNTGDFKPARIGADLLYDEDLQTKNWQTCAMSLRFTLTFGVMATPLFAYVLQNWWYLLTIPFYLLSGLLYRYALRPDPATGTERHGSLRNAEYLNGALLGTIRGSIICVL